MSNAARKARKQAGEKFVRIPKEKTPPPAPLGMSKVAAALRKRNVRRPLSTDWAEHMADIKKEA